MRARWFVLGLVAVLALVASGCTPDRQPDALRPTVGPPAIKVAGVLRVGVDESYPPFAAKVGGSVVGLDADVAAALAERLGLRLELVDVKPADAGKALRDGAVDVALGGMPITDAVLADASFAGTYLTDGPALFASTPATVTPANLEGRRIAVQQDSAAHRALAALPGRLDVVTFPTLRAALQATAAGKADVAAGDAVVSAYIARDIPGLTSVGQLGEATPLGVAVPSNAPELEAAVRDALDSLATGGVLDAIRYKWVGRAVLPSVGSTPSAGDGAGQPGARGAADTTSAAP